VQKVIAKVLPATVGVRIGNSAGSGVIVSEDGLVMTAGHVVGKPGQDVTFFFHDGKTAKGKTLGMFVTADAGMMKITDAGKYPFVELGTSADLKSGTWCVALGHPLGYQPGRPPVVRVGRVLRIREAVIQTDCTLVGGDSGGPLFDLQGRVIGIHSRIAGPTDVNLHVPVDIFRENWDRLLKGDSWQEELYGRDSTPVKSAFRSVVAEAARCTVRIKCDGQEAALGTIVGPDGWILTKASELKGNVVCRLADGRELPASIVGINKQHDLAMLKIPASGLPVIPWSTSKPGVGQWLAAAGTAEDPLALGVLSVPQRRIPPISGVLGVNLKPGAEGPAQIEKVLPNSPAEKAGLKDGDVITHVDGQPIKNGAELVAAIKQRRVGDLVRLNVKRGESVLAIAVKLGVIETPGTQKREMQNRMGVGISGRYDDFPAVLQHDAVVRPSDCGGPVVDLSGKVVGVNIARGGRTETYCIPTDVLLGLMYELMSGRLAPPVDPEKLAAERKAAEEKAAREKAEAERKAAEQKAAMDKLAQEKAEAEKKAAEAEKKAAEAEKKAAEAEKKAGEALKKAEEEKAAREKAEAENKSLERQLAQERAAREALQAQSNAQQQQLAQQKAAREKAEADMNALQQAAAAERTARQKLEADIKSLQERLQAVQQQLAEEKSARQKVEAENKAAQQKAATADTLSQEKQKLLQEKEGLVQEREKLAQEKEKLTQEKHNLAEEKRKLTEEKQKLTEQIQKLAQEKSQAERVAAEQKAAMDKLAQEKAEAEKKAAEAEKKAGEALKKAEEEKAARQKAEAEKKAIEEKSRQQ
jgi:serine protease Do